MANPNRPARLNRTLLLLTAMLLLAAAAFALLTATGRLTLLPAEQTLTPPTLSLPGWVPYLAVLLAVIVGLLALRWLIAQTRRRAKSRTWRLDTDPATGATRLDAQDAVDPLVKEVESYPGVHHASARLAGSAAHPTLYLTVGTEDAADITDLRARVDTHAVPRLRHALDLEELPVELLVRLHDARSARLS